MQRFYKQIYSIDSNKIYNEVLDVFMTFEEYKEMICGRYKIRRKENIQFEEKDLGTFLIDLLNSINKIKNVINGCKASLEEPKKIWRKKENILKHTIKNKDEYIKQRRKIDTICNNSYIKILLKFRQRLLKINPMLIATSNFIYQQMIDFDTHYQKRFSEKVEKLSKKGNISKIKTRAIHIMLGNLSSIHSVKGMIDNILSDIEFDLEHIKIKIDKTFIHSDETRNNKFSGIHSYTPICQIDYTTEYVKSPQAIRYTYVISDVYDTILRDTGLLSITNATIYQLTLNHKVIIKCRNCGKYLIPDRTDRIFCDNDNKCKNKYFSALRKENYSEVYNTYRDLYNKYKNTKTYAPIFEEFKTLYQDCKSKQLDDEEIMKILTNFDETVKSTYNVKRGRPKKQ